MRTLPLEEAGLVFSPVVDMVVVETVRAVVFLAGVVVRIYVGASSQKSCDQDGDSLFRR